MRAINRAIDRFCQKNRKFGIPRLMIYIVAASAAVLFISMMDTMPTDQSLLSLLAFSPGSILRLQVWRLVTWILTPLSPGLLFNAIALYFYYFIGSTLEREWGTAKFTIYYVFGVVLHLVYGFLAYFLFGVTVHISPFYLNMSMFFAFAVLFPEQRILLFFFIPVKIKWLALINAALFAYNIIAALMVGAYFSALMPLVALLNFFIVCGNDLIQFFQPLKSRVNPATINFKRAARQARSKYEGKHHRHKCAVCGRTDTENPSLEFRYCSRCNGYHCFCIDHINNHVHFQ